MYFEECLYYIENNNEALVNLSFDQEVIDDELFTELLAKFEQYPLAASRITEINLINHSLTGKYDLNNFKNLQILRLGNNRLVTPPDVSGCLVLRFLDISDNRLKSLPDLANNEIIQILDLSGNEQLNDVIDLSTCEILQQLNLTGCSCEILPTVANQASFSRLLINDDISAVSLHVLHGLTVNNPNLAITVDGTNNAQISAIAQSQLSLQDFETHFQSLLAKFKTRTVPYNFSRTVLDLNAASTKSTPEKPISVENLTMLMNFHTNSPLVFINNHITMLRTNLAFNPNNASLFEQYINSVNGKAIIHAFEKMLYDNIAKLVTSSNTATSSSSAPATKRRKPNT